MNSLYEQIHSLLENRTYDFRTSLIDAWFFADIPLNDSISEEQWDYLVSNLFELEPHYFTRAQFSWLVAVCEYYASGKNKNYVFASCITPEEYKHIGLLFSALIQP